MKIFKDNKVYVQLKDLAKLNKVNELIPANLYKTFLDKLDEGNYDREKAKSFVSFEKENEVETIRNFDWIVDYDEVKDYSLDEFQLMANRANNEANELADIWNSFNKIEKQENYYISNRYELLHHEINDIRQILWTIQGYITTPFPEEVNIKKKK